MVKKKELEKYFTYLDLLFNEYEAGFKLYRMELEKEFKLPRMIAQHILMAWALDRKLFTKAADITAKIGA